MALSYNFRPKARLQNVVEDVWLKLEWLAIEPTPVLFCHNYKLLMEFRRREREINDTMSVDRHNRLNLHYNEQ
ncbi:MAG: hypothetical protein ACJ70Y_02660 [Nitrososphaera sp.]